VFSLPAGEDTIITSDGSNMAVCAEQWNRRTIVRYVYRALYVAFWTLLGLIAFAVYSLA